ncbi:hypothetical protein [Geodermatophilus sabuli]|uniref:Cell division protein FtsL n=1 Tax=Geodermatophilus sabuli TaxID=1564158 RepID=A0A285E7G7_9ACTN|nr:hypothetical protein [Geodermatophilus sabuli]MBB3082086.1 hypothetical protein [Geodermatophilus sabuli]SNX95042.1 hypothetical protein SAMN06893097_101845 [Geodermatophilus sabuli]
MSAAAGLPPEPRSPRSGTPSEPRGPRAGTAARRAPARVPSAPATGERAAAERTSSATAARARSTTAARPPRAPTQSTAAPTSTPAPARNHTAPVRVGSLRARPPRASAAGPAARPAPAPPGTRARRGALSTRRGPLVLLVVGMLVATALGLLILNTAIAVNSLKATQLAAANADRAQEVERLEQQVIAGGTSAALAAAATAEGLVPAGSAGYLVVGEDGTVTLRGEPVPAEVPAPPPEPGAGG